MFTELGFRTLGTRVKNALGLAPEISIGVSAGNVSAAEISQTGILLWLLESERTNPSLEDIIDYGQAYLNTSDFKVITKILLEK